MYTRQAIQLLDTMGDDEVLFEEYESEVCNLALYLRRRYRITKNQEDLELAKDILSRST